MIRAHVIFEGKVQGVYFRAFVKKISDEMGINGWVKNLSDGNVEAVFEGEKDIVEKVIERCSTEHPRAIVRNTKISWEEPEHIIGFEIKY
ncbi:MAG: acylphosphatase [Thermoplasmata archaeon]|nr:acylphosphatase [Thermoplasmata archaeon]MVT13730.1 acylphosphatase [Euryarchaeota archaeon]